MTGSSAWLEAKARSDAIRAARPWVVALVDIPGYRTVPAGTVGREAWRGTGAVGTYAESQVWVQVIFEGFGARDCRPDQIAPSVPGDEGKLFRV